LQTLLERIDSMWLEEVKRNVSAELLHIVNSFATEVEKGAVADDVICTWRAKSEQVEDDVRESLRSRMSARENTSLKGGYCMITEQVTDHVVETCAFLEPLVCQLRVPARGSPIKEDLGKRLCNTEEEYESIAELKMANMELVMELDAGVELLNSKLDSFLEEVLWSARRSPHCLVLQQKTLRAVLKMIEKKEVSNSMCTRCDESNNKLVMSGCVGDISKAMSAFPDDRELQFNGCKILAELAAHGHLTASAMILRGADRDIMAAQMRFSSDESLQAVCSQALRFCWKGRRQTEMSCVMQGSRRRTEAVDDDALCWADESEPLARRVTV